MNPVGLLAKEMVDDPFDPIREHTLQQNEELFRRTGAAALNLHQSYPEDAQRAKDE